MTEAPRGAPERTRHMNGTAAAKTATFPGDPLGNPLAPGGDPTRPQGPPLEPDHPDGAVDPMLPPSVPPGSGDTPTTPGTSPGPTPPQETEDSMAGTPAFDCDPDVADPDSPMGEPPVPLWPGFWSGRIGFGSGGECGHFAGSTNG